MGPATKTTADRLAAAIRKDATEHRHHKLADRAAAGEFADFGNMHVCPITELHRLCLQYGLHSLAARVANGEFDASKEESDEWASGPDGQEIARQLPLKMRKLFNLHVKN